MSHVNGDGLRMDMNGFSEVFLKFRMQVTYQHPSQEKPVPRPYHHFSKGTLVSKSVWGKLGDKVSLTRHRVLDRAPLRAVSTLPRGAVNALGSVCQECWAQELSFPGVSMSGFSNSREPDKTRSAGPYP